MLQTSFPQLGCHEVRIFRVSRLEVPLRVLLDLALKAREACHLPPSLHVDP